MNGSIICGVDGSDESRAALRVAAQLADSLGLRLVMAHVTPAEVYASGLEARAPLTVSASELSRAGERLLEQVAELEGVVDAEPRALCGLPAERLADLADEEAGRIIVVGSRGRGAFKSAFLGSVSSDVIGLARCPVLVVPPAASAAGRCAAW
ncbi:MAG TPA: universal stress protein [Gaiellaceae bacterium]|nr:universal stress protein [Gaiellaceae bacterium]